MKSPNIKNPLSAIGLFVGFSEAVILGSSAITSSETTKLILYAVMSVLVLGAALGFFYLLIKNPSNLYAPSDFKDEENYLHLNSKIKELENFTEIIDKKIDSLDIFKYTRLNEPSKTEFLLFYSHLKTEDAVMRTYQEVKEILLTTHSEEIIDLGIGELIKIGWIIKDKDKFLTTQAGIKAFKVIGEFVYGRFL